jgi:hypothetical protein
MRDLLIPSSSRLHFWLFKWVISASELLKASLSHDASSSGSRACVDQHIISGGCFPCTTNSQPTTQPTISVSSSLRACGCWVVVSLSLSFSVCICRLCCSHLHMLLSLIVHDDVSVEICTATTLIVVRRNCGVVASAQLPVSTDPASWLVECKFKLSKVN